MRSVVPSNIPLEEQKLLNAVTDPKLRLCLDSLRLAVEALWQPATPRIVQDFTDHGIAHYERIARYATNLLSAKLSQTAPFSPVEMFLFVASIYLHDVGMQCDVTTKNGQEIKKRAEKLGADFVGVTFTPPNANSYSLDEQKAIRKNHHFLSAAWIEYAHETNKTVVGPVLGYTANLLPFKLVSDLMDVCLHHTSLPIEQCSSHLAGGGGRKRLVAALLRFADELDISSNRVEMAQVTQFAVNPDNAVFWWLHNLTEVTFNRPNVFRVTVQLREEDFAEFAPLVHAFYLQRFRTKNKETLQVLQDSGFPVYLDASGEVVSLRYAPALSEEVREVIKRLGGNHQTDTNKTRPVNSTDSKPVAVVLDDVFNQDPVIGIVAADRLAASAEIDLEAVVSRLQALTPVIRLSARTLLLSRPEESSPIMVRRVLDAQHDWHAAAQVPSCFGSPHAPYCVSKLTEAALRKEYPNVARLAIESLGYLGASDWDHELFELYRDSGDYWRDKVEYHVVLALARLLCQQEHDTIGSVHRTFRYLTDAVLIASERGWRSILYSCLRDVLAACPVRHADMFLREWVTASHPDLKKLGIYTCGQMRLTRAIPQIQPFLETSNPIEQRCEAAIALANIGGAHTARVLREQILGTYQGYDSSCLSTALARALPDIGDIDELKAAATALLSFDFYEKLWVYRALGLSGDAHFVPLLEQGLTSIDPTVRGAASLALARVGGPSTSQRLMTAYTEAGTVIERTLMCLAIMHTQGVGSERRFLKELRSMLCQGSYQYVRLLQDDILTELRCLNDEEAELTADCWERVYTQGPDY